MAKRRRSGKPAWEVVLRPQEALALLPKPGDLFYVPLDDRLVALCQRAGAGEIPTTVTTARVSDVAVHNPAVLERFRASLQEEPSSFNRLRRQLLEERPPLVVYRDDAGRLVMFDDYGKFAVAQALGLAEIPVRILGE